MSQDDPKPGSLDRRRFLGYAGASLTPIGAGTRSASQADLRDDVSATSATERLFEGPIRKLAVDPAALGPHWTLKIEEVSVVTGNAVRSVASGDVGTTAWLLRQTTSSSKIRKSYEAIEQELIQHGLRASSELFYKADFEQTGRDGMSFVNIGVFDSTESAAWFLRRAVPVVSEESGYAPLASIGDEAFEAVEFKWSVKGKIRFRRSNVYVSVLPTPPADGKLLAGLFDRRIAELIGACSSAEADG